MTRHCRVRLFLLRRYIRDKRWSAILKLNRWIDRKIPVRPGPIYPPYGGWLTDAGSKEWHAKAKPIYEAWKDAAPKLTFHQEICKVFYRCYYWVLKFRD